MKTKEFIKAVKKLGYYPLENNAIIKIAKSQTIPLVYADVATKHQNALQTDYFPFTELSKDKQAELFDVLIEYARTPLEEREEELNVPIAKYKAKADDKMRFTKENVDKLFSEHDEYICFSINDLRDEILNLDDTPEKVVVPKYIAEWYESQASSSYNIQRMIKDLLNGSVSEEVVLIWLSRNYSKYGLRDRFDLLALIRINGYTIAPEQLYYIPLPDLETTDGIQQVLSKRKGDKNYFASRPNDNLKQRFTKEELAQVPEVYKPYAKPIEEEEK